jgi:putative copper export protein
VFLATDLLVIGLRALSFVAIFQAAGGTIFLLLYERGLAAESAARIRRLTQIATVVALCSAVLHYVLTPARMAGDLGSAFDPSLEALLLGSNSGSANIVRVVGLALLTVSLDRATRVNTFRSAAGVALTLVSFAFMGHTAIHAQRWALAPLLLAHIGVAAFWFGALWPLHVIVRSEPAARAGALVAQFSALATRLVPAILLCGVVMAVLFIQSLAELATGYGALVLAKTAGFGVLMALAAVNKWRFGPEILRGNGAAVASFRRTVAAEWGLIAAILIVTAVLTSLFAPEHLEGAFGPEHQLDPEH